MSIQRLFALVAASLLVFPAIVWPLPPNPARIGGTVTLINSVQVRSADNIRTARTAHVADDDFSFKVSRADGSDFEPAAEDADGLNSQDHYVIDIPIHHAREQTGGALSGEMALVRVFVDGRELNVVSPPNGRIIVGNSGSITPVDLVVQDAENGETLYTQSQLDRAVRAAVETWDVGGDGVIDLREAIRALMIAAGVE